MRRAFTHYALGAFASDDWEVYGAENDLREGGSFKTIMAAKDKSASFDFRGVYTAVKENELIEYDMDDGRHVKIVFAPDGVKVIETFDPENENSEEIYVLTRKEDCPIFIVNSSKVRYWNIEDPFNTTIDNFRKIRDEIKLKVKDIV